MVYKRKKKATKITKTPPKKTKSSAPKLVYKEGKWVVGATQIKKLRDKYDLSACPVSKLEFGTGLEQPCLDHCHDSGKVRGVLSGKVNLFLGRIELYYRKLLSKTGIPLDIILENLVDYLRKSEDQDVILHGAVIEAERRFISRWKNETIYNKLLDKGLTLLVLSEYTKEQLVHLYLQDFIFDLESKY